MQTSVKTCIKNDKVARAYKRMKMREMFWLTPSLKTNKQTKNSLKTDKHVTAIPT